MQRSTGPLSVTSRLDVPESRELIGLRKRKPVILVSGLLRLKSWLYRRYRPSNTFFFSDFSVISFSRMKIILTGIQPSGALHLGNYFRGDPSRRLSWRSQEQAVYFIADYHALTSVTKGR